MYGNFERCYATVRVYEGGKVDHKKDPGGRTNKGVTQNTFNAWLRRNGKPLRDVYSITDDETQQIYHDEYWKPSACDELPAGVDLIVFDTAINSGNDRSGRLLQATLNASLPEGRRILVDGDIGSKTLEAVKAYGPSSLPGLIDGYCNRRLAFLKAIRGKDKQLLWNTFGKGWGARVGNVRAVAKSMVAGSTKRVVPNTKLEQLDTAGKAYDANPAAGDTALSTETATQAAGGAAIGGGVLSTLQNTATTFQGLSEVAAFFKYAFIAITVGLAVYAIYTAVQSKRRAKVMSGQATVPEAEVVAITAEGARNVVPA